jgi:hypothetical protein
LSFVSFWHLKIEYSKHVNKIADRLRTCVYIKGFFQSVV